MRFPNQILEGTVDEVAHQAFLRYGKGEYNGPATEVTITKTGKVRVRSTYLYQELVASVFLKQVPLETLSASGIVIGSDKLDEALATLGITPGPLRKVRQAKGYTSKIAGDYSKSQLISLYEQIGATGYILCTLKAHNDWNHTAKTKIPDPRSTATIDTLLKFSTTRVPAKTHFTEILLDELVPDFQDTIPSNFSLLKIENVFDIKGFVFPPNKDQLSSSELRLQTKRELVLRRSLLVDGVQFTREHEVVV